MTLTIADAEDAFLEAQDNFTDFLQEFNAEWHAPLRQALMGAMMATLPPEVVEELRARNPQALEQVLNSLKFNR